VCLRSCCGERWHDKGLEARCTSEEGVEGDSWWVIRTDERIFRSEPKIIS